MLNYHLPREGASFQSTVTIAEGSKYECLDFRLIGTFFSLMDFFFSHCDYLLGEGESEFVLVCFYMHKKGVL